MSGCALPVAIVCGSGNQGITCALPVLTYAEELGIEGERLTRALALADLVAIHTKSYIGALSAFCGVVCAACGAGAAICWMRGGTREQIGATVANTSATWAASCATVPRRAARRKIPPRWMPPSWDATWRSPAAASARVRASCKTPSRRPSPAWVYVGRVGMKDTDVELEDHDGRDTVVGVLPLPM